MIKKFFFLSAIFISGICSAQVPMPDHVVIVVEENHGYGDIIGSSSAPYINQLANDTLGALFTQSYALTHPSQPNYLMLFSGSDQGVTSDSTPLPASLPFITANLAAELFAAGKTFMSYSDSLPSVGYSGDSLHRWTRKHAPWVNWQGMGVNGIPDSVNVPFTSFPTNYNLLPTLSFVIPNLDNNMHDGSIAQADAWLLTNLDGYVQWAKTNNSLLILTFDEDDYDTTLNQVTTIFIGQMVKAGQYSEHIDHYCVLRTVEDMFGLPHAGNSAACMPITDCWLNSAVENNNANSEIEIFPNPSNGKFKLSIEGNQLSVNAVSIYNSIGEKVYSLNHLFAYSLIDISSQPDGIYFLQLKTNEGAVNKKIVLQK